MLKVALYNKSAHVTDDEARAMTTACQTQLCAHVAPAWDRLPPSVVFYLAETDAPDDAVPFYLFDSPDTEGALGYHSEGPDGQAYSKIFVDPIIQNGSGALTGTWASVSSVLSHELCEWFVDPSCNVWVDGPTLKEGSCYAYESSDPVQGTTYNIELPNGTKVMVEDFVFPSWFDEMAPKNAKRDWCGVLTQSYQLGPGGYCVVRQAPGDERQIWGTFAPPEWRMQAKAQTKGRTYRRTHSGKFTNLDAMAAQMLIDKAHPQG